MKDLKWNFCRITILPMNFHWKEIDSFNCVFKHVIYNSLLCHASYDCEILFITHCYIRQHFSSAYIWFYVVPSNGKNHSACFVASLHS